MECSKKQYIWAHPCCPRESHNRKISRSLIRLRWSTKVFHKRDPQGLGLIPTGERGMAQNDDPPLGKFLASSGMQSSPFRVLRAHFCEEKATRDKAVKHLVQFLSQPTGRALSDDLELAKLWKGIFYCALTTRNLSLSPIKMLTISWKKVSGCPTSLSSSKPWHQNLQTFSSKSLIPPPPSSSSRVFGTPSFANGMASTVSGTTTLYPTHRIN